MARNNNHSIIHRHDNPAAVSYYQQHASEACLHQQRIGEVVLEAIGDNLVDDQVTVSDREGQRLVCQAWESAG